MLSIIRPYNFNPSSTVSEIFQSRTSKITSRTKVWSCCGGMYPFDSRSYLTSLKASKSGGKLCDCAFTSSGLKNSKFCLKNLQRVCELGYDAYSILLHNGGYRPQLVHETKAKSINVYGVYII